jgi:alkylation response protein AidB-like acyl-CoA dehydrogenase
MRNEPLAAARPAAEAAASLVPQLAAAEPEHDLAGRAAVDNLDLLAGHGLLLIDEGLDGTLEVLRTLAHGSPSTALMLAMHTAILGNYRIDPRHVPASERAAFLEQRDWAFAEAARGKRFAVANSERGAAGDVKHSRAEMREGRLYGTKTFCSMGTHADYYMAAARDASGRVDYWLVRNENVFTEGAWNAIGMRSSESVTLRFDGAPVLGALGYRGMLDGVNNRHWSTLAFTAIFIGIAESLLDDVVAADATILLQAAATELQLTVQACRAFLRHCVAIEPDPADDTYRHLVRDCKLFVTRSLAQHAAALFTALGGSAYRSAAPASRKLRDLLAGPALRPPAGIGFDEVWAEMKRAGDRRPV